MALERDAAPLAGGAERDLRRDHARRRREALVECLHGRVAHARARREQSDQPGHLVPARGVGQDELVDAQSVVGEGPGLVEADRVDARQALGRVQALGQGATAAELDGRGGEGQRRQEEQSLRDHRDERRDHLADDREAGEVRQQLDDRQEHAERQHHRDGQAEHAVDVLLQRTQLLARPPGLGGQTTGVAVGSERLDPVVAGADDAVRARADVLPVLARDGVGLAGEDRFVHGEGAGVHQGSVGHDLVAGDDPDHVADHELVHREARLLTVSPCPRPGRDQQLQSIERAFRADLLDDPDQRVGDDHAPEQGVSRVAEHQRQHEQRAEDEVEDRHGVGPDDLQVGAAGPHARGRTGRRAGGRGLGRRQAERDGGGGHCGAARVRRGGGARPRPRRGSFRRSPRT